MGTTRLYSSVHFHSFRALIRIFRHAPGNIRGEQVPEKSPYNKSLGKVPLCGRPNLITADQRNLAIPLLVVHFSNGIAAGTSPWDFSLRVSNRNCTLNMFEWNLRAGEDDLPARK